MSDTQQTAVEQRDAWTLGPRDLYRALDGETVRITTGRSSKQLVLTAEEVSEADVE